jgi:hypothetical protein
VAAWVKAAASGQGNCVEVAAVEDLVLIRDSKTPHPVLIFTRAEWDAFKTGVTAGDFDHI